MTEIFRVMVQIYETYLIPIEHKSNAYVLDENGVVIFSTGVTTDSVKKASEWCKSNGLQISSIR